MASCMFNMLTDLSECDGTAAVLNAMMNDYTSGGFQTCEVWRWLTVCVGGCVGVQQAPVHVHDDACKRHGVASPAHMEQKTSTCACACVRCSTDHVHPLHITSSQCKVPCHRLGNDANNDADIYHDNHCNYLVDVNEDDHADYHTDNDPDNHVRTPLTHSTALHCTRLDKVATLLHSLVCRLGGTKPPCERTQTSCCRGCASWLACSSRTYAMMRCVFRPPHCPCHTPATRPPRSRPFQAELQCISLYGSEFIGGAQCPVDVVHLNSLLAKCPSSTGTLECVSDGSNKVLSFVDGASTCTLLWGALAASSMATHTHTHTPARKTVHAHTHTYTHTYTRARAH